MERMEALSQVDVGAVSRPRYDSAVSQQAPAMSDIVDALSRDERLGAELVHRLVLSARHERRLELDPAPAKAILETLSELGGASLWSHQTEAIHALRSGLNVLVTTPTASGKSLIFQLPVLEAAADGESGNALFLYPLKALGRDQASRFGELAVRAGLRDEASCAVYDGDTPASRRQKLRQSPPRVLITNPDMLHLGILGYPENWQGFLRDLRWIVLDEIHTYRGIFGAHFHHVLQRLRRLAGAQGAAPQVIASSATAANADRFAEALVGAPFHWVSESGSPREARHLLLFNPTASPYTTALRLLTALLESGLKTIVFTKARRITELMHTWLQRQNPRLAARVAGYRSGFLPEERRRIESRLFSGELDGVIATSALEMGIDVGGLDACILVGFPGSIMATWQRSGRAGRGGNESLTALVALPDALDQYLLDHPEVLTDSPCERLAVDPENEPIARQHLVCAAAELPLSRRRDRALLERHAVVIGDLLREHELKELAGSGEIVSRLRRPQRRVQLRGSGETIVIRTEAGQVVGTVDGVRAFMECHPGAVYLHAGRQYQVHALDLGLKEAVVREADVDFYTTPLTEKTTEILELIDQYREGSLVAGYGRLRVTEQVLGFERRQIQSRESLGQEELDLPPTRFETAGLWWLCPPALASRLEEGGWQVMGSLHAAEHAAIALLPLVAVCDRGDIGGISIPRHPQLECGAVFIYDGHAGGVGIARRGFDTLSDWLGRVVDLLRSCDCEDGCPRCVQSPKCGNGNRPLDKAGALAMLENMLTGESLEAETLPLLVAAAGAEEADEETSAGKAAPADGPESREDEKPESRRLGQDRGFGTVLFDLETQLSAAEVGGWNKAHRMRVAIGVACVLEEGRFEVYREEDVPDLIRLLEEARLVVGFNIERFDYRVLSGYTGVDYARILPTFDLLQDIHRQLGFRLSLNHLAQETLGVEKSADGLQSLEWFKQGRLDLIEQYCRKDVEILRDLFLYGRRMGHVLYRDRQERQLKLPVDWDR